MSKEKETKETAAASKKHVVARVQHSTGQDATFHRAMRDESGNVIRTLEFPRGAIVEVDADELKAIIDDIRDPSTGKPGGLLEVDEKKNTLEKPSEAVAKLRKEKEAAEKKRQAEKAKAAAAKEE